MADSNIEKEKFGQLLEQIRMLVLTLRKKNRELNRENQRLRNKLDELQRGQSDIFSAISEKERIAMRHKISGLIEKIDNQLDEG